MHVMDLADGHVIAMERLASGKSKGFAVYNLGTGSGYSVLDMVKEFSKVCGLDIPYVLEPRRSGDVATCFSNPSLAAQELNWTAKRGLKEVCEDAWRWQNNNKMGFSK